LTSQSILKLDDKVVVDINKSFYIEKVVDFRWFKTPFLKFNCKEFSLDKSGDVYILNILFASKYDYAINQIKKRADLYEYYYSNIKGIESNSPIYSKDINKILSIIYMDVYIYIDLVKIYDNDNHNSLSEFFYEKIKPLIRSDVTIVNGNKEHEYSNKVKPRNGLFKTNTNSFEWRKDKTTNLDFTTIRELKKLKCKLVEIPKQYKKSEFRDFLIDANYNLEKLNLKHHNFELRFKKLGLYKKEGMFIKKHNILIIDPRKTKAFYHELGHFIYENGLSFNLNGKRVYKSNFESISKKENIDNLIQSKLEDYDIKSEKFAYWFENNYQVK
jgi:hypothetical protein